jgi:hypothetical protein
MSEDAPKQAFCSAPEYHEFDFWIGDWDAFDADNPSKPVARLRVDRILEGCVLREDYQGADGHKGQSLSVYDASRKVWHQTWVTNRGELLTIEGKLDNGAIVMSGVDYPREGVERHVRGTWKAVSGGFRETAVISTDDGKTWKPWFNLIFHPHSVSRPTN